ncbi:MAG: glycoside hydrolase family 2 protein [Bacteroidales bacterium]|nr:glycoside hydrolase family 2 protein [Bacteroidales bacterium]
MKKFLNFIAVFLTFISAKASYEPQFSTAGFYALEGTGRKAYSMNIGWRFVKSDATNAETSNFDDSKWAVVCLPHGLEYLPVEASGGINYQGPAWYRKHFTPDDALKGKKLFLHFEAIMGKCKVWVNGILVTEHFGGYLPVIADISSKLKWGEDNVIAVKADNSDDPLYLPGKSQAQLDFCYFGGIYRDSWLIAHNEVFITDPNFENEVAGGGIFISYNNVSDESAEVNLKLHLRNEQKTNFAGLVEYELLDSNGKLVISTSAKLVLKKGEATYSIKNLKLKSPRLWSPESPYLYYLNIRIKDNKGKLVDGYMRRIGIRAIEFKQKDGLWLNGKPYNDKLIGANRHQDFAVVGNALSNSTHWRDAKKLRDAGMKAIRNAHYPQDPAFMDACDELGLFVIVNTPGWQFWNNAPIFSERLYSDIRNMVRRDRNCASLFFWEPVLNETSYPAAFAKNAVEIVKNEYPYPYSTMACDDGADGAQYFSLLLRPKSKLDSTKTYFIREWGDNVDDWKAQNSNSRVSRAWGEVPMLVQAAHYGKPGEVNTKWPISAISAVSPDERKNKAVFNGICLENLYTAPRQIVGACLWHSFDHQRGYHADPQFAGIMDAFRQPKYAYYIFQSQRSAVKSDLIAETGPMVFIAHEMTPFSPKDVTVYSNCDEVRLTFLKDSKPLIYKKEPQRLGMPSPPIIFSDVFDFMSCKSRSRAGKKDEVFLLAEGLIDGKVVATCKQYPSEAPDHIRLRLDNDSLNLLANGSDFVTVIAELVDKKGIVKRLNNSSVAFSIEGEGRLLGDESIQANPCNLSWGSAPILVQATTKAGKIKIFASILHEGGIRPISGELVFSSVENKVPGIFNQKDADLAGKQTVTTVLKRANKSELEIEVQKLRKELNDYKIKEVEKQQNKFGEGIN